MEKEPVGKLYLDKETGATVVEPAVRVEVRGEGPRFAVWLVHGEQQMYAGSLYVPAVGPIVAVAKRWGHTRKQSFSERRKAISWLKRLAEGKSK